jgi:hypothetical protein
MSEKNATFVINVCWIYCSKKMYTKIKAIEIEKDLNEN